jgi:hypothetical protein
MKNLSTCQAIFLSSHKPLMNTSQWRNYISIWGSIFTSMHSLQKWYLFFHVLYLKFCLPSITSPSQEANSYSASKEFPYLLWNQKVHYHAHKSPSLNPILSHINPVHILILSLFKIHVHTILTPKYGNASEVVSFLQVFLDKFCMYFSSLPCKLHALPITLLDHLNNISWWVQITKPPTVLPVISSI